MTRRRSKPTRDLNVPQLGTAVPGWGNRFSRALGRTFLRLWGWRFEGSVPNLPKFIIIGAPHTSNWDFLLAMAVVFAIGIRFYWLGKHTFVNSPLRPLLVWLGGVAVNRRAPGGVVRQIVDEFERRDRFILGLAPEGTRSKVSEWKMGFYHIARQADVPIVPIALDFGRKVIGIGEVVQPTADKTAVLQQIESFYEGVVGKNPEQASLKPTRSQNDR